MDTAAPRTTTTQDDEPSTGVAVLTLVLLAVAIYVALAVLHLGTAGTIGFVFVTVGGGISAVQAVIKAARGAH